jgi:hypothetical protein
MRVHRYSKTKQKTKQKTGGNRNEETTYSLRENSANHTREKTRTRGVTTDPLRTAGSQQKQINKKRTGLPAQTDTQPTESKKCSVDRTPGRAYSAELTYTQTTASKQCSVDRTPGRAYSAKLTYAKTGGPRSVIRPPRPANSAKLKTKIEVSVDSRTSSSSDVDRISPRGNSVIPPSPKKLPQIPKVRHKIAKTKVYHNITLNSSHKGKK